MSGCGTHTCNECIRWREQVEAELDKADRRAAEAERVADALRKKLHAAEDELHAAMEFVQSETGE